MSRFTPAQLIIPNENLGVNQKKVATDGNGKSSKTIHKKTTAGLGRKALNDITNKSTIPQEAPVRKQERVKEEIDVAGESFLHDHDKCIDAQKVTRNASFWDLVLPGHDSLTNIGSHASNQSKIDVDIPFSYPNPDELIMHECNNWWKNPPKRQSPSCSQIHWGSPSISFSWQCEEVNFVLRFR